MASLRRGVAASKLSITFSLAVAPIMLRVITVITESWEVSGSLYPDDPFHIFVFVLLQLSPCGKKKNVLDIRN